MIISGTLSITVPQADYDNFKYCVGLILDRTLSEAKMVGEWKSRLDVAVDAETVRIIVWCKDVGAYNGKYAEERHAKDEQFICGILSFIFTLLTTEGTTNG